MKPRIVDEDTGRYLWTAIECAEYMGISRGTFTSYTSRKKAPEPVARYNGLTLWDSEEVRAWAEDRNT